MNEKTAILIFTRRAEEESEHRKYALKNSSRKNKRIVGALIQHTVQAAQKTGLDYFEYTSNYQTGNTFGQRLANAFYDLFHKGYDRVIALGNDCPYLKPQDILRASRELQTSELVLGPDHSGGAYLIGLQRRAFMPAQFESLPWQQDCLLEEFLSCWRNQGYNFTLLSKLKEVDDLKGLQQFIYECRYSHLATLLKQFLEGPNCWNFIHFYRYSRLIETLHTLRAPPLPRY